jgi:hypothetical protein
LRLSGVRLFYFFYFSSFYGFSILWEEQCLPLFSR